MSATRSSASDVAPARGPAPHRRGPVVAGPPVELSAGHRRRDVDRGSAPAANRGERAAAEDAASQDAAREEARRENATREITVRQDSPRAESTREKGQGGGLGRPAGP